MAEIVNGREIYNQIIEETKRYIHEFRANIEKIKAKISPKLSIIAIGEDKEMEVYIRNKKRAADICGIEINLVHFQKDISQRLLEEKIEEINESDSCGIIVQLPLPKHIDKKVLDKILPSKDVDCLTSENLGSVLKDIRKARFIPCACLAMLDVFDRFKIDVKGKYAVVIGASDLVGKPCASVLLNLGATVTVCHKYTENIEKFISEADIVVSAVGKPGLVKGNWIKNKAVIIDIGTRMVDGKILGDVEFDLAKERASIITPVPGGIGLITVAELMKNIARALYLNAGTELTYSISAIGSPSPTDPPSET